MSLSLVKLATPKDLKGALVFVRAVLRRDWITRGGVKYYAGTEFVFVRRTLEGDFWYDYRTPGVSSGFVKVSPDAFYRPSKEERALLAIRASLKATHKKNHLALVSGANVTNE